MDGRSPWLIALVTVKRERARPVPGRTRKIGEEHL